MIKDHSMQYRLWRLYSRCQGFHSCSHQKGWQVILEYDCCWCSSETVYVRSCRGGHYEWYCVDYLTFAGVGYGERGDWLDVSWAML